MSGNTNENTKIISFYSSIIVEAFDKMTQDLELTDKSILDGGREGKEVFGYERESLKFAIVIITFVGTWLHASLRLRMLNMKLTEKAYNRNKGKPFEQRLMLIGCYDEILNVRVSCFRMARNKIIYEMEYFDKVQVLSVEEEAEKAYHLFVELTQEFKRLNKK